MVQEIVNHRQFSFRDRPMTWIVHFFQYLYIHYRDRWDYWPRSLRLLKVRNGSWIAASDTVYQPNSHIDIPDHVHLNELDRDFYDQISKNICATWFLEHWLGVYSLTHNAIVDAILKCHKMIAEENSEPFSYQNVLTGHASYLLKHLSAFGNHLSPYKLSELKKGFLLLDNKGGYKYACHLVQDTQVGFGNGQSYRLSDISSQNVAFLNRVYDAITLSTFFSVKKFPSLFLDGVLAPFYATGLAPSRQKDNRLLYLIIFEEELREQLNKVSWPSLNIPPALCENGRFEPLGRCYLRTKASQPFLLGSTNVLQLHNPEDQKWTLLGKFGVALEPDSNLFLENLRRFKNSGGLQRDFLRRIQEIYAGLQRLGLRQTKGQKQQIR